MLERLKEIQDRHQNYIKINQQRSHFQFRLQNLLSKIENSFKFLQKQEKAAIYIQKIYRGYSVRTNLHEIYIKLRRKELIGNIRTYKRDNFQMLFHTGELPIWAGSIIQTAVKRYLFRRKIQRIKAAYQYFMNQRMYICFALIRRYLYVFKAKNTIKWKKFKIARQYRMVRIKQRLAVLVIKAFWQRNKLSFKILKRKIRRYKRKLLKKDQIKQEVEVKLVQQVYDNYDQDSQQEQLRLKVEAQKKHKMKMSKIAYKIPKPFKKKYNLVKTNQQPDPDKFIQSFIQYKSIFQKQETSSYRKKSSYLPKKRFWSNYMDKTKASKMKYTDINDIEQPLQAQVAKQIRPQSTMMNMTNSFRRKTNIRVYSQDKKQRKPIWKPNIVAQGRYTPALDNSMYKPVKPLVKVWTKPPSRPSHLKPLKISQSPKLQNKYHQLSKSVQQYSFSVQNSMDFSVNNFKIHVKPRLNSIIGYSRPCKQ